MIQIDDAGSGSFVGGTCIGVYRPETNEYFFDIIPVELYDKKNFKQKHYLDAVVQIVARAFQALDVRKSETVEICRGYMFERLKPWLEKNGFCWYCTHITGHVQEVVEKNFELYTVSLGLPRQYIKYTHYPFHFHKLLRWVYADFENRIPHCKVGWKSWERIEGLIPEVFFETAEDSKYICLKCGYRIPEGSDVKILRYVSNKENYVVLHQEC